MVIEKPQAILDLKLKLENNLKSEIDADRDVYVSELTHKVLQHFKKEILTVKSKCTFKLNTAQNSIGNVIFSR